MIEQHKEIDVYTKKNAALVPLPSYKSGGLDIKRITSVIKFTNVNVKKDMINQTITLITILLLSTNLAL